MDELVALLDSDGRVCGSAPRSVMRRDNLRHAATGVLVRNSAGDIYVHRRTATKDVYPRYYDFMAGGVSRPVRTRTTRPCANWPRNSASPGSSWSGA